jgi:REP element-mobilizing transposase RayT
MRRIKMKARDEASRRNEKGSGHGGFRKGSGRKSPLKLKAHARRPELKSHIPVHVTIRLVQGLPSIRRKEIFRMWRRSVAVARKKGFGVAHFAIISNHAHFIIEPNEPTLTRQMKSLCISFAKRLNHHLQREGSVFLGRYHQRLLTNLKEVRDAIRYVVGNEARHKARRTDTDWWEHPLKLDPFSSITHLKNWRRVFGPRFKLEKTGWEPRSIQDIVMEIVRAPASKLVHAA